MLSKNQIKEIQSLQLKKFRDIKRKFIVEGIKPVVEILEQSPALVEEIFATNDFIKTHLLRLNGLNLRHTEVTEAELKKISLQSSPNSVIAICNYIQEPLVNFDFNNNFTFYLDDIRDPGNMGTIIRLADWFGLSVVFCSPSTCDFYNPKVIQSTMGAFMRVHVVYLTLEELLARNSVVHVYGAVLHGKNIYKQHLKYGLIVIGNEANGISNDNLDRLTERLTIPAHQNNETESLNAAMAASIMASEFFRQLKQT